MRRLPLFCLILCFVFGQIIRSAIKQTLRGAGCIFIAAAQRVGKVFSAHVIPRAMPEVFCMLASGPSVGPGKRYRGGCASCGGWEGGRRELAAMVRAEQAEKAPTWEELRGLRSAELKQYAGSLEGFSMSPAQIRAATKERLLQALARHFGWTEKT